MSNPIPLSPEMINKAETVLCDCGHHFFIKKTLIKKVPSVMIGKFNFLNLEITFCESCGATVGDNPIDFPGKETGEVASNEPDDKSILPGVSNDAPDAGMKIV